MTRSRSEGMPRINPLHKNEIEKSQHSHNLPDLQFPPREVDCNVIIGLCIHRAKFNQIWCVTGRIQWIHISASKRRSDSLCMVLGFFNIYRNESPMVYEALLGCSDIQPVQLI